jgi:hypothetical protein
MFDDSTLPDVEPTPPDSEEAGAYVGDDEINNSIENTNRIDHYIHLYFVHFHQHWPFLHRSTFSIPDEPPLLLQAVLMIGLWVSGTPTAQQDARHLHTKLGLAISAQKVDFSKRI